MPYLDGTSEQIFDPNGLSDSNEWYVNDHNFIVDQEGTLHWFGINNPYPPPGKQLYVYHPYIGHLKTNSATGTWTRLPMAINEIAGTEYLGAPYVIWHDESSRYAMVLEIKRKGTRRLAVYWSTDLNTWQTSGTLILPKKLWISTRDPHIMKGPDNKYWIHVVSSKNRGVKNSQILRIRTTDFVTFESPETVLAINDNTHGVTYLESPFLIEHSGRWYMFFTYAHRRYNETVVVGSSNPDSFNYYNGTVTTLFGHAAEIFEYGGKTYISSSGPEDKQTLNNHSITLAELLWGGRR